MKESFLAQKSSWQPHLQQISRYPTVGEDVWWKGIDGGYKFYDADCDSDFHVEGPMVRHFRSTSIKDIIALSQECWKTFVDKKIPISCLSIRLYDRQGNLSSILSLNVGNHHEAQQSQGVIQPLPHEDDETLSSECSAIEGGLHDSPYTNSGIQSPKQTRIHFTASPPLHSSK